MYFRLRHHVMPQPWWQLFQEHYARVGALEHALAMLRLQGVEAGHAPAADPAPSMSLEQLAFVRGDEVLDAAFPTTLTPEARRAAAQPEPVHAAVTPTQWERMMRAFVEAGEEKQAMSVLEEALQGDCVPTGGMLSIYMNLSTAQDAVALVREVEQRSQCRSQPVTDVLASDDALVYESPPRRPDYKRVSPPLQGPDARVLALKADEPCPTPAMYTTLVHALMKRGYGDAATSLFARLVQEGTDHNADDLLYESAWSAVLTHMAKSERHTAAEVSALFEQWKKRAAAKASSSSDAPSPHPSMWLAVVHAHARRGDWDSVWLWMQRVRTEHGSGSSRLYGTVLHYYGRHVQSQLGSARRRRRMRAKRKLQAGKGDVQQGVQSGEAVAASPPPPPPPQSSPQSSQAAGAVPCATSLDTTGQAPHPAESGITMDQACSTKSSATADVALSAEEVQLMTSAQERLMQLLTDMRSDGVTLNAVVVAAVRKVVQLCGWEWYAFADKHAIPLTPKQHASVVQEQKRLRRRTQRLRRKLGRLTTDADTSSEVSE